MNYQLICGNSLEELKKLQENSVDSIVTDPPYHLKSSKDSTKGFMGKEWDGGDIAFKKEIWQEALRVLKPGGHLLAFSGTRTVHRMVCAIEDAGFEIRDMMTWNYSTGFPKSLDISKAIDKKFGAERKVVGYNNNPSGLHRGKIADYSPKNEDNFNPPITAPATEQAKQWDGWGTALKPSIEPICVARKPLSEKTVAENVLKWGVGGLNIDGCRVETSEEDKKIMNDKASKNPTGKKAENVPFVEGICSGANNIGRWPANFIHDGLQEEWARFFYCAKASRKDRNEGLDGFEEKVFNDGRDESLDSGNVPMNRSNIAKQNFHPTVKPTTLMQFLVRLVTPPNGTVLDPFNGSGSTGKACMREGFNYIGIDLSQEYLDISKARIEHELRKKNDGI